MRNFIVHVNGKAYDVAVEETGAVQQVVPEKEVPVQSAPAPEQKTAEVVPVKSAPVLQGAKLEAPMPGTILEMRFGVGDQVTQGDVLFILEAMKLENDLQAPASGVIASLHVQKGDMVNSGDVLCVIS